MSIRLLNFGKIKNAEIKVDGLTIIAGKNDTGKSTIGKSLYAIIKSITAYPEMYEQLRSLDIIFILLPTIFNCFRSFEGNFEDEEYKKLSNIRNQLVSKFPNNNERFLKSFSDCYTEIPYYLSILDDFIAKYNVDDDVKKAVSAMRGILSLSLNDNEKFSKICSEILIKIFKNNVNNSVTLEESVLEYKVGVNNIASIKIKGEKVFDTKFNADLRNNSFRDAILIDSPLYLEDEHEARHNFVQDLKDKIAKARQDFKTTTLNKDLIDKIENILNGATFVIDDDKQLGYLPQNAKKALPISNIASGAKSFGLVYLLLKSGILVEDSLLILDEPENHLHPEWQIKYAEMLVSMVNKGYNVLLTSHSPTFIHALSAYSRKYLIEEKKVNFYLAQKIDGENYSNIINVNSDIEKIFDNLCSPNDILYLW